MLRPVAPLPDVAQHRPASGREQHSHKITVYLSADELLDLERARLILRRFGIAADRGRLVRESVAVLLADLDVRGEASVLAQRIAGTQAEENMPGGTGAAGNGAGGMRAEGTGAAGGCAGSNGNGTASGGLTSRSVTVEV